MSSDGTSGDGLHAYFETQLFVAELDDAEADRGMLGSDCADWFRSRLAGAAEIGEAVRESWGWAVPVVIAGQSLWLMLQKWHSTEHGWHVWIEPRGLLGRVLAGRSMGPALRLRDTLNRVLADEPRVSKLEWVADANALANRGP
jgi:hypothetical protein